MGLHIVGSNALGMCVYYCESYYHEQRTVFWPSTGVVSQLSESYVLGLSLAREREPQLDDAFLVRRRFIGTYGLL